MQIILTNSSGNNEDDSQVRRQAMADLSKRAGGSSYKVKVTLSGGRVIMCDAVLDSQGNWRVTMLKETPTRR